VKPQRTIAVLAAVAALAVGCSRAGTTPNSPSSSGSTAATQATGTFGSLGQVCGPGSPTSSPDQGVTTSSIRVGMFTDIGFTRDPTFEDTAKVFTDWCNAAGGIDGRKIVYDTLDTDLFNVQAEMVKACGQDFVLAGGGAALDNLGVETRLKCLLPSFPAQVTTTQNWGSSLQVFPSWNMGTWYYYTQYYNWLIKQAYPDSAQHVGIIAGDEPVTVTDGAEAAEAIKGLGGNVPYQSLYPPTGVADWTPYAEAIKAKGIKALIFLGQYSELAKLELILTNMSYKLDWIDANSDSYTGAFLGLAGPSAISYENNLANLSGLYPVEEAANNPADKQLVALFAKYEPDTQLSLPAINAFASWLLFAASASSCGNNLTRTCIYDAALKQTSWTAGGLMAPVNLSTTVSPPNCWNVEKATPSGWVPASFGANDGAYACGGPYYKLRGNYGSPLTLANVGESLADLK
jgi:Periplasmic binding protein